MASIEYLKLCEYVFLSLTLGEQSNFIGELMVYGVICALIGYIWLTANVMLNKSQEDLMSKEIKSKYGNLY